jgi:hypothetical protein
MNVKLWVLLCLNVFMLSGMIITFLMTQFMNPGIENITEIQSNNKENS